MFTVYSTVRFSVSKHCDFQAERFHNTDQDGLTSDFDRFPGKGPRDHILPQEADFGPHSAIFRVRRGCLPKTLGRRCPAGLGRLSGPGVLWFNSLRLTIICPSLYVSPSSVHHGFFGVIIVFKKASARPLSGNPPSDGIGAGCFGLVRRGERIATSSPDFQNRVTTCRMLVRFFYFFRSVGHSTGWPCAPIQRVTGSGKLGGTATPPLPLPASDPRPRATGPNDRYSGFFYGKKSEYHFPNIPFPGKYFGNTNQCIHVPVHCWKLFRGKLLLLDPGFFSPPPGHRGGLGFGKTVPRKHPATLV